jgi:hypothetical protein
MTEIRTWTIVAGAGATLGAVGITADIALPASWAEPRSTFEAILHAALAVAGNGAGFWTLAAVVVAYFMTRSRPKPSIAIVSAALFLVTAVMTYYLMSLALGARIASTDLAQISVGWLVLALVAGPVAGLIALGLRSSDRWRVALAGMGTFALLGFDLLTLFGAAGSYLVAAVLTGLIYFGGAIWLTFQASREETALLAGLLVGLLVGSVLPLLPMFDRVRGWAVPG